MDFMEQGRSKETSSMRTRETGAKSLKHAMQKFAAKAVDYPSPKPPRLFDSSTNQFSDLYPWGAVQMQIGGSAATATDRLGFS
jgi:hypothetical protein